MELVRIIRKIRTNAHLSQEQFAELMGVSRQAVQKWEKGTAVPDLEKLIKLSKYFGVSLDALVLDSDTRITEELEFNKALKPKYANVHSYESYGFNLETEYRQCVEEGLDVSAYADVFSAVSRLPQNETKEKLAEVLFDVVLNAKPVEPYPYVEPSTLDEIRALRKNEQPLTEMDRSQLERKIHGAWMGRVCGCLLGKAVEGIRTNELIPFLKETGNYPMKRYILRGDVTDETIDQYSFRFPQNCFADTIDGMPVDDDTNYVVLAQEIIERYGRDFTPYDVSRAWMDMQSKSAYCTAERVAFCNFVRGFEPPESALYKNPFREWIGAQIRGDYFGYINPGDPEMAAEMAFRDASISHIKNGIYGEMFISAMIAAAACANSMKEAILSGLAQIPHTSRLYEAIVRIVTNYETGVTEQACFADIHKLYDEHVRHCWCHTIPNAMIVVAALLYGNGDFGRSICMAVETGFDTDCNGATVGSVLGMLKGIDCIDAAWTAPIHDTLHTAVFGVGTVRITDRVKMTLCHIR